MEICKKRAFLHGLAVLCFVASAKSQDSLAQAPTPAGDLAGIASTPLLQPALASDAWRTACPEVRNIIYSNQLANQSETICVKNGLVSNDLPGRFGRNTPFGFTWQDITPNNCTIFTVTIAIQAGISCTTVPGGGNTTLNGQLTSARYRFPFGNEYGSDGCDCQPEFSALQVFIISPDSYNQSGSNTFSILGSTGSNGLRPILSNVSGGIYGAVIINQWAPTAPMTVPRTGFGYVATPLGNALAVGGYETNGVVLGSGDDYNPLSGVWLPSANNMETPRALVEVANLQTPGNNDSFGAYYIVAAGGVAQNSTVMATADLYNTSNHEFTPIMPMHTPRVFHQLTPLFNRTNRVIVTGGVQGSVGGQTILSSAEFFDWDQSTWTVLPDMNEARYYHQAVELNGTMNLMVTGGRGGGVILSSTEIFDDVLGQFNQTADMNQPRFAHRAIGLANGSVLVLGGSMLPDIAGQWQEAGLLASCEMWDPFSQIWSLVKNMTYARVNFQAELLSDGTVFVAGGGGQNASLGSELWSPRTGNWTLAPPMLSSNIDGGMVRFVDDTVLAFGGAEASNSALVNGTTNSGLFTPAFNLTQFYALLAPAMAPALSPEQLNQTISVDAPSGLPSGGNGPVYNIAMEAGGGGLSGGAIAGIAVGICVLIILVVVLFVLWWKQRRRLQRSARAAVHYQEDVNKAPGYPELGSHPSDQTTRDPTVSTSRSKGGLLMALSTPFSHIMGDRKASSEVVAKESDEGMPTGTTEASVGGFRKIVASPFDSPATVSPANGTPTASRTSRDELHASRSGENSANANQLSAPSAADGINAYQSTPPFASDEFNASELDLGPLATRQSTKSGRSIRSDLSRVSLAVKNELHGAEWKIDRCNLELGKRLGKGGFGEVFEGRHHGSAVAIKVLEITEDRMMLSACEEFGHLHNLRHSKLVISYGACVDRSSMLLVMELMEEDLFHAISSDTTGRADSALYFFRGWRIAVDIASALVFLHSKGLVHLDVKSLNILLKGNRMEAKLADLGLSKMVPDGHLSLMNTLPGTPAYSAPEVIGAQLQWRLRTMGRRDQFKTEVGTPADIFAFGVVMFEICTGQHPARWRQDFTGEFRKEEAPPAIGQLVDRCLDDEPAKRPTAQEVLKILMENQPGQKRTG